MPAEFELKKLRCRFCEKKSHRVLLFAKMLIGNLIFIYLS